MFDTDIDPGALALLQQGYRNNWRQYLAGLGETGSPGADWDMVILTASNARQAQAYETQLATRRDAGQLSPRTAYRVIADPDGLRIGSGGATLRVLAMLAEETRTGSLGRGTRAQAYGEDPLGGRRVLIIHSGGDSRRLPHCSATGKLFARVPHELPDGRASSLFDEFVVSLGGLPRQIPPGVLVASGDVLLLFDHLQLLFARPGISGVAAVAPAETGTHHGVYVPATDSGRVDRFLHKPSLRRLCEENALQPGNNVLIDTGLVWFDPISVAQALAMWERVESMVMRGVTVNLYGDLLAPLAESTERQAYLEDTSDGPAVAELQYVRQVAWETLRGTPLSVERLDPAVFIHFGTTREYLDVLSEGVQAFSSCWWSPLAGSWVTSGASDVTRDLVAANACLCRAQAPRGYVLDTLVERDAKLGEGCLVANVMADGLDLVVPPHTVLHQLPVLLDGSEAMADGGLHYCTRFYGVSDDPKRSLLGDGTFMNMAWRDWLAASPIDPGDLWPESDDECAHTLWNARLFPVCRDRQKSLETVLWLAAPGEAHPELIARWRAARRVSLSDSFRMADVGVIVREQERIADCVRARRFYTGLETERPAHELAVLLGSSQQARAQARSIADRLEAEMDPWLPIRGYRALAIATGEERWNDRAFSSLARLVRAHTHELNVSDDLAEGVAPRGLARAAARIDFGGGWTDTPPYSLERGGAVLNAAITLYGEHPILAEAERLDEPALVIASRDLGASRRIRYAGQVLDFANPADPYALHKAALVFRGIVPPSAPPETEIASLLRLGGYGLRLTTGTRIPRGSGLGTSSILAGAILAALSDLLRQPIDQAALFDEVLCLEQMITTGGGWQDQIGGLVGGCKYVTTVPGLPQVAHVETLTISEALRGAFADRLRLVYTGQRRLAKGLLRAMMGRYMARDPEMVAMLGEIGRLALEMRRALDVDDLDTFGELIAQHWEINKRMDADTTTPFIDDLIGLFQPYAVGCKLAGAGGGGFAIVVTRDAAASDALDHALVARFGESAVRAWPFGVARQGLVVGEGDAADGVPD